MGLTIEQLEAMCLEVSQQRGVVDALSKQKQEENKKLEDMEARLLEALKSEDKDKYQSNVGTVYTIHKVSYKIPRTAEDRKLFFDFLRERGVYEELISINSNTLNSFCREAWEQAKREENSDFSIPGLGDPEIYETLGFKKK